MVVVVFPPPPPIQMIFFIWKIYMIYIAQAQARYVLQFTEASESFIPTSPSEDRVATYILFFTSL